MNNLLIQNMYSFSTSYAPIPPNNYLKGKSILYIDDEYVNYLFFSELLSDTGVNIIRACSFNQATIRVASGNNAVCLVMVSTSSFGKLGNKIVSQMKKISPDLPVIGIIDQYEHSDSRMYVELGCDLYLNRHIDKIHLVEIMNELLENSSSVA